jgi:chemotaxis protein histidine kinase CheA
MTDWQSNTELVAEFQSETRQKIAELRTWVATDGALANHANLLRCFSHAHSLKGLAGFMEFHDLEAMASALNEIFRAAKDGKHAIIAAERHTLQQALACCEQLVAQQACPQYAQVLQQLQRLS